MSSAPGPKEIARDATWLAQALDPSAGQVRLVAMDRDSYRAASFLDDRLFQQPVDAQIVAWTDIEAAVTSELRSDARWIFHIGHVGSTLVSRLLGELDGVLALREPRLLRDLAMTPVDIRQRYLRPVTALMSRTFSAQDIACVKATSFASEVAADLVPPAQRALFMYATPGNYIGSILAGENSLKELRMLAGSRAQRLQRRSIVFPGARNDADLAATAWACEMTTLQAAVEAMKDRSVEWADFDEMLIDMAAKLGEVATFFGLAVVPEQITAAASGPLMHRYSKDLGYAYSASLRQELIGEASIRFAPEIGAALAMLESAAEKAPLLARALERTGAEI